MATTASFQPSWWNDSHGSAWERIKEALKRDWEQTKQDLNLPHGHELNQSVTDTIKQAAGTEPIPPHDRPNPPKVIGTWDDVESHVGYGYGARHMFGNEHPVWNEGIEEKLRAEWEVHTGAAKAKPWTEIKEMVRHGYEYKPRS